MGLFKSAKRFVKKITKPVSKVLDKVVPNELKPLLPYAAAFAPYMMPAGFGMGASSGLMGLLKRSALTGGLNLGAQLSQEGSEGEFSGLSALLAAGQGFGTGKGAQEYLSGLTTAGKTADTATALGEVADKASMLNDVDAAGAALGSRADLLGNRSLLTKAKDLGLSGLAKTAGSLQNMSSTLQNPGINMETAKAAMVPFTQGSGDLAMAAARTAMKDYEAELNAFNAQAGETQVGNDNARRSAITSSMLAANFAQDVIDSTLAQIGLKDGGRVGKMNGGIMNAKRGLVNAPGGYAGETEEVEFGGIREAVENSPMSNERVVQMYVSDSAGVIPLADGDAVKGKTMDMMAMGAIEPYGKNDFRDPDGYERFIEIFTEFKDTNDQKNKELNSEGMKKGGIAALNMGGSVLPSGGEMDYRAGGFIPMGSKEKADDVPARLSKNEFVMTADAVKAAGGGSVNQGAKRMYNLMNNLEARV